MVLATGVRLINYLTRTLIYRDPIASENGIGCGNRDTVLLHGGGHLPCEESRYSEVFRAIAGNIAIGIGAAKATGTGR